MHADIGLITNDGLLRQAAELQLGGTSNFGCYSSLEDFTAFAKAAVTAIASEELHEIVRRAHSEMYRPNDPTSFWFVADVDGKLRNKFGLKSYANTVIGTASFATPSGPAQPPPGTFWLAVDSGTLRPTATAFISVVRRREFHWRTAVQFVGGYKQSRNYLLALGGLQQESEGGTPEWYRHTIFDVYWQSDVAEDRAFKAVTLGETEMIVDRFTQSPMPDISIGLLASLVRFKRTRP